MTEDIVDPTLKTARESDVGQRMTDSQFDEAWQVTGIVRREIRKTASFIGKLTDYAHAFARDERFDAARGEMFLRDLYTSRYGETMNDTRAALLDREKAIAEDGNLYGYTEARGIEGLIADGETMPFYLAYDRAAVEMARSLEITERTAKRLMASAFEKTEGQDFYGWGKALEAKHCRPKPETKRIQQRPAQQRPEPGTDGDAHGARPRRTRSR